MYHVTLHCTVDSQLLKTAKKIWYSEFVFVSSTKLWAKSAVQASLKPNQSQNKIDHQMMIKNDYVANYLVYRMRSALFPFPRVFLF